MRGRHRASRCLACTRAARRACSRLRLWSSVRSPRLAAQRSHVGNTERPSRTPTAWRRSILHRSSAPRGTDRCTPRPSAPRGRLKWEKNENGRENNGGIMKWLESEEDGRMNPHTCCNTCTHRSVRLGNRAAIRFRSWRSVHAARVRYSSRSQAQASHRIYQRSSAASLRARTTIRWGRALTLTACLRFHRQCTVPSAREAERGCRAGSTCSRRRTHVDVENSIPQHRRNRRRTVLCS